MAVDFGWQIDRELPPEEPPEERPRPAPARWLLPLSLGMLLLLATGYFWWRVQTRRLAELESAVAAVARLELRAWADGDYDLYLSLQDNGDPAWFAAQKIRTMDGAAFPLPLPGLTATGVFTVGPVRVVGDRAQVEVNRTAYLQQEGEIGHFRALRFYRRASDGRWLHTAPTSDEAGRVVSFVGPNLELVAYDRDRQWLEPLAPDLEELMARLCDLVTCRYPLPLKMSFTGLLANVLESETVYPALFLVGVPADPAARAVWEKGLQNVVIAGLLTGRAQLRPSRGDTLFYDRLLAWLRGRLGLSDPVHPDIPFLRERLAEMDWLPLWSLLWSSSPDRGLAAAESDLFLAFVEEEYGPDAVLAILDHFTEPGVEPVISALKGDLWDLEDRFDAYVRRTVGLPVTPADRTVAFAGYDLVAGCRTDLTDLWGADVGRDLSVPLAPTPLGLRPISWSPDGRYLVATRLPVLGGEEYLLPTDGSPIRKLEAFTATAGFTAWSPNGHYLAYATLRWPERGGILNVDTGAVNATLPGRPLGWSPDGGLLACVVYGESGPTIWLADEDGSHPRPATAGTDAAWSPDGRFLAVFRRDETAVVLYDPETDTESVVVDGPALHDLLPLTGGPPLFLSSLVWSPTGDRLGIGLSQPVGNDFITMASYILLVTPDGHDLRLLADSENNYLALTSWSPDGRYLLLLEHAAADLTTTTVLSLAGEVLFQTAGNAVWSPDGSYLAVFGDGRPLEVLRAPDWGMVARFGARCDAVAWNPKQRETLK